MRTVQGGRTVPSSMAVADPGIWYRQASKVGRRRLSASARAEHYEISRTFTKRNSAMKQVGAENY